MLRLEEEDIYAGIATSGSGGGGDTPESAKGSFNASTQQLTLNYDYLVEMINSSTVLTDAQKTAAIAELDNSDVVVGMTTSIMPENEYMYCFQASSQVGLFVDVATPVTLKMVVVPSDTSAVISAIGTYKAIADFNTFMGVTMTEEQAEEQYAPLIVDENLCTVSGTLGNFSVEFIEDAPVIEKYGATISNFLGDVDENGILQAPSGEGVKNLSFNDVVDIDSVAIDRTVMSSLLSYKFYGAQNIGAVSFPVLTHMRIESMYGAFAYSSVTSLSFPKLTTIEGYAINNAYIAGIADGCSSLTSVSFNALTTISIFQGFVRAFRGCTSLTSVSFPELTTIDAYGVFGSTSYGGAFEGCTSLTTVTFPKLSSMTPPYVFQAAFRGCTSLTSVSFPALTSTSFGGSTNQFNQMLSGCTGVTVHFPSNLQSVIGSWSDVTAGFGGTNTTILFDLPATE